MPWSIICPTYNRGPAITRTVRSVMAQSRSDWELIVVSDASTDDTDDVVRALAREDDRVRLLRTPRHGHPSGPCNAGVADAQGELIATIGHDDELLADHLATLSVAMTPGVDVVYTQGRTMDADRRPLGDTDPLQQYWHPELQLTGALFEPARAGVRRAAFAAAGGWRETAVGLEDWDLWLRLSDDGARFAPVADVSVAMLRDPGTRQHTLDCEHRIELARFDSPPAARAAYRALTDRRRLDGFLETYRDDARRHYSALWASGEMRCPAAWADDEERMLAALEASLHAESELWQTTRPASHGDVHVLENVIATQTAAHAARVGAAFARTMPGFMAAFAAVVSELGGEPSLAADRPAVTAAS